MQNIYARTSTKAEVFIYGAIGDTLFHDGVKAQDFIDELDAIDAKAEVSVRINSPGGSVWDGFAIYNALKKREGKVSVQVDGLAASIASVIAMAAAPGKLAMGEGAIMMIHDPWQQVTGNAAAMRTAAEVLEKVGDGLLQAYAARSKKDATRLRELMAAETWMTADEAIAEGLADAKVKTKESAKAFERSSPVMACFRNVPGVLLASEQLPPSPGVTGEKSKFQPIRLQRKIK